MHYPARLASEHTASLARRQWHRVQVQDQKIRTAERKGTDGNVALPHHTKMRSGQMLGWMMLECDDA